MLSIVGFYRFVFFIVVLACLAQGLLLLDIHLTALHGCPDPVVLGAVRA